MSEPKQLPVPLHYVQPPVAWFDIDSLDRENFRYHLEMTPAQEAWLAQAISDAQYKYRQAKRKADAKEDELWLEIKAEPLERMTAKGVKLVDASDELATRLARQDPVLQTLRREQDELQATYKKWQGMQRAFSTKKAVLASLAGLTRTEMEIFGDGGGETDEEDD